MKKIFIIFLLLILSFITLNVKALDTKNAIEGTWTYKAEDAPYGYQAGKMIFYQESGAIKAKIKIHGYAIETENLKIEGDKISFTSYLEHEQIAIILELKDDTLQGVVRASEGAIPIKMFRSTKNNLSKNELQPLPDKLPAKVDASKDPVAKKIARERNKEIEKKYRVHIFYYGWYGNSEFDGEYNNWNHPVIPHWIDSTWNNAGRYPGGENIGANFYPQLGSYSASNPEVITTHLQQIRDAGIGVVVVSWWGKDSFTYKSVQTLLDTAHKYDLKLAFHIEPIYNTVEEFRGHLEYISANYAQHPALYKHNGKPLYYLYNSFKLKRHEWNSMLNPDTNTSIRNTHLDGVFIGLWTTRFDGDFVVKAGMDGFYTYFASDRFAFGSTTSNWPYLSAFAQENNLLYIPCVGPGYTDTRIRPWNDKSTKSRDGGIYYEKMFENAVYTNPDYIGITSFNEWHEGTQIEPAVPKKIFSYTYEDYGKDIDPLFYIHKTRELITKFEINSWSK